MVVVVGASFAAAATVVAVVGVDFAEAVAVVVVAVARFSLLGAVVHLTGYTAEQKASAIGQPLRMGTSSSYIP